VRTDCFVIVPLKSKESFLSSYIVTNQALIARHFVEHDREGFARAWLRTQELSWAAGLLKD